MEQRLINVRLWSRDDGQLNQLDCSDAWQVLSRLGAPYRFAGHSRDGLLEYLVLDPKTGEVIATGRGESTPLAMFEAAIAACEVLKN